MDPEPFIPLARWMALKLRWRFRFTRDEAVSIAYLALLMAAKRYDPTRMVRFQTFLYSQIRYAFLDEIRLDHCPRVQRRIPRSLEFEYLDVHAIDTRIEERVIARDLLRKVQYCTIEVRNTYRRRRFRELILAGYNQMEAARIVGFTQSRGNQLMQQLRRGTKLRWGEKI